MSLIPASVFILDEKRLDFCTYLQKIKLPAFLLTYLTCCDAILLILINVSNLVRNILELKILYQYFSI